MSSFPPDRGPRGAAEERSYYSVLFENAPVGIQELDLDGRLLSVNPAGRGMMPPVGDEPVAGRSFLSSVADADRGRVRGILDAAREGQPQRFRFEAAHRPGSLLDARLVPLRGRDGRVVGLVGLTSDLSEQRRVERALEETEQRLRDFADTAADWFWEMGADLRFRGVFGKWESSSGLPAESVVGLTREQLWEGRTRDSADTLERVTRRVRAREPFERMEIVWIHGTTGEERNIAISGRPVYDRDGSFAGYRGSAHDITDWRRIQRELQESRDRLRRLVMALEDLRENERAVIARDIHDDVGQALTALHLDLSRLRATPAARDPEVRGILDSMASGIESTMEMTRRIASSLRPAILDDLGLQAAVEWMAGEFAERTGIACAVDAEDDVGAGTPQANTAAFRIFQEALTNVARHARAASVRVRLHREGDALVLEVRDDGVGIDEKAIADVRSIGILGMRERAGGIGGELTIDRPPDGGTRVVFRLPIASATGASSSPGDSL